MSFNRVLPKPQAVYHDPISGREYTRRGSNLLDHKIMSESLSRPSSAVEASPPRRDPRTVPSPLRINSQASRVNSAQPGIGPPAAEEPPSPLGPLTRKRAATLMASDSSPMSEMSSKPPSSAPGPSSESSSHFCLCQPDPKIPRPRNAFILYRQHYQGAVVAQNPGLANPDISKILGEHWRQLQNEVKNQWKSLAEEEKVRHQQQYPEYRYKPRRFGRNNPPGELASVVTSNGSSRCGRCGGRVMATPNTPSTPFSPTFRPPARLNAPPSTPARYHPVMGPRSPGLPQPQRTPTMEVRLNGYPRRDIGPPPSSPDPKRRRFTGNAPYAPGRREISPETPHPYPQRQPSLSRPEQAQTPRTFTMGPPPRPHKGPQASPDSLTLPPIQTPTQILQNQKSVEAMVMTIPFLNKIKVLSKITPPLSKPNPMSPAFAVRGAIIAIEGRNTEYVKQMVSYVETILAKAEDPIGSVKVFSGPEIESSPEKQKENDSAIETCKPLDPTLEYLDIIAAWHKISASASVYITTPPTPDLPDPESSDSTSSATSLRAIIPKTQELSLTSATNKIPTSLPIALIPRYQLTTSDHHACRIPINDAYSPFDHWQWMATLWRNCVGPDMTIYIRECERDEFERAGGVEIRLSDANVLVVRVIKTKDGTSMGYEDRVLRRLGFEVEEWVRGRREAK